MGIYLSPHPYHPKIYIIFWTNDRFPTKAENNPGF